MRNNGKGDTKGQRKRRRIRWKYRPKRQTDLYELIDGNLTHYPRCWCQCHGGFVTDGLMETHKCLERHCVSLKTLSKGDLYGE